MRVPPPGPWSPQNLTGWRVEFTAKYHFGDPDKQAVFSLNNASKGGIVLVNPPTVGKVAVTMPAIGTRAFPDGLVVLAWDLQCVDPSGNVRTVAAGPLGVFPNVTNSLT